MEADPVVPFQPLDTIPSGIAIAGDAEEVKVNDEGDTIFPDKVVDWPVHRLTSFDTVTCGPVTVTIFESVHPPCV